MHLNVYNLGLSTSFIQWFSNNTNGNASSNAIENRKLSYSIILGNLLKLEER